MPGDDEWERDEEWRRAAAEDAETKIDGAEAVPEATSSKDSTGKHKTLPGLADSIEQVRVHYRAEGRIYGQKEVFTALRLIRIGAGDHPDAATTLVDKLKKWMAENEKLIHEAMKD